MLFGLCETAPTGEMMQFYSVHIAKKTECWVYGAHVGGDR
jgi:hypothetical protein